MTLIGGEESPAELSQDAMTVTALDTINLADSLLWTAGETVTIVTNTSASVVRVRVTDGLPGSECSSQGIC